MDQQEGSKKRKRFRFENLLVGDEECCILKDNIRCTSNDARETLGCLDHLRFFQVRILRMRWQECQIILNLHSDVFSLGWKQFWGMKIPRILLHFAWRGYHKILPTRNGLFRRNIASNTSCQLCGFGGESNAHAIFWCPVSLGIWNLLEFFFLLEVKEEINFKNVLLYASQVVERDAFAKLIMCSCAIWTERNKIAHGQQIRQPQNVVD
ncbi:hypothetical protein G4B88_010782 [Cannabis sativa]|uniref:Reverse transcriptase zinc-binding domain-containing protein n=1 Tax=Cannabis sativa TaxID=3483 RepID=A0A7J6GDF2_CANSA|nr:hypothetical protein G4B88_010782 [Cannabis sativa]